MPKLLGRIQMVRDERNGEFLVPVTINGVEKQMLLDVGGVDAYINRPVVEDLHLPVRQSYVTIYDSRGNLSKDIASIGTLMVGPVRVENIALLIGPDPDAGRGTANAGRMGIGMLANQDIDVDLGSGLLTLFSQEHCPERLGYWEARPPDSVAFNPRTGIMLPASLDGRTLRAYFSSTNWDTLMRTDVARSHFGLTGDSPGMEPAKPLDALTALGMQPLPDKSDTPPPAYMYTFQSLSFAGVTVKKPRIRIYQSVMSRYGDTSQQTANRALRNNAIERTDELTIGMNLLRHLHIYIAPREKRIYMSGAFTVPGAAATAR